VARTFKSGPIKVMDWFSEKYGSSIRLWAYASQQERSLSDIHSCLSESISSSNDTPFLLS